jgi:DNA-binding transcriptional regulator YdaS (Cro superfamily)
MNKTRDSALERAITAAGSLTKLAAALNITKSALSQWRRVPPMRVLAVEAASGVSRHELRPDLYPVESVAA